MAKRNEVTPIVGFRSPRTIPASGFQITADQVERAYGELRNSGIFIPRGHLSKMMTMCLDGVGMDDLTPLQPGLTTSSLGVPIQFLQAWLPGFVQIMTQARKIDEIVGLTTVGSWEDEEVIQGILEHSGFAVPYTDNSNIPLANYNVVYERRTVIRFEQGFSVGLLEEARAARQRISMAAEKRVGATVQLEIARNLVGFVGFNGGQNRTYGYLNDPSLPAYITVPAGAGGDTEWTTKTALEIIADLRMMFAALRVQSGSNFDPRKMPSTLALATASIDALTTPTEMGMSVLDWLSENYPNVRIVDAPELDAANGGSNVGYLHADTVVDASTDDNRVFDQIIPAKFFPLGIERQAKRYVEDFSNATAGVLNKRPFMVVRVTGI